VYEQSVFSSVPDPRNMEYAHAGTRIWFTNSHVLRTTGKEGYTQSLKIMRDKYNHVLVEVLTVFSSGKQFSSWLCAWLADGTNILIIRITFLLTIECCQICFSITCPMNKPMKTCTMNNWHYMETFILDSVHCSQHVPQLCTVHPVCRHKNLFHIHWTVHSADTGCWTNHISGLILYH
jgi:hypothetical protein